MMQLNFELLNKFNRLDDDMLGYIALEKLNDNLKSKIKMSNGAHEVKLFLN